MSQSSGQHGLPQRKTWPTSKSRSSGSRYDAAEAPQDNVDCAYVTYIWGVKKEVLLEMLTLGASHEVHGSKIQRVVCANSDTRATPEGQLLRAFWKMQDVEHMPLPKHLKQTEIPRLQGVYSKLQTWGLFAKPAWNLKRVLLMDGDMILNGNIDDVFATRVPAAVMRGEADTNLGSQRPAHTYFAGGDEFSFTGRGIKMKGGINGGLVLFEPSQDVCKDMLGKLEYFQTPTNMAEQDFLSWYWGRNGKWWALHKKFNFQLHQLYFSPGAEPPRGQGTPSSYWWLLQHPADIKVYHYSGDQKPSHLLLGMDQEDVVWTKIDEELEKFLEEQEAVAKERRAVYFDKDTVHRGTIHQAYKTSLVQWLEMWKKTWLLLTSKVLNACWTCVIDKYWDDDTQEDRWYCKVCGEEFQEAFTADEGNTKIRDHLMFNCSMMRSQVCISLDMTFDQRTLFHVPTGSNVWKKLSYIAKVLEYYEKNGTARWDVQMTSLMSRVPVQIENSPMHDLIPPMQHPRDMAFLTMHDKEHPKAEEEEKNSYDAVIAERVYHDRAVQRRYTRAIGTIYKRYPGDYTKWTESEQKQWVCTLKNAASSAEWLVDNIKIKKEIIEDEAKGEKRKSIYVDDPPPPWRSSSSTSSSSMIMPTVAKARTGAIGSASKAKPKPTSAAVKKEQ